MDQQAKFFAARSHVLEKIVDGASLAETLEVLCLDTEDLDPRMRCTVLLLDEDGKHMRHAAAPSMPDFYNKAISGLEIGEGVGSCGTAMFTAERVIVEDVFSHPFWAPYKDLAAQVGFAACWSHPILSKDKRVLGSFAMYYDAPRSPSESDLRVIEAQAALASIAIERITTETALQQSESRFRDFAETSADWFWEQDENLRFTNVSVSKQEHPGLEPSDYVGKTRREIGLIDVPEKELLAHERLLAERRPFSDFRFCRSDGDGGVMYVSVSGKPIFDAEGVFKGYRGTGRDVTQLGRAEAALMADRDKAQEVSRAKSSFLANMSHEFRTPLNGIIGYLDLLSSDMSKGFSPEKVHHIIEDVHAASKHLLTLVNDILDLSRIEAGMEDHRPEVMDVRTAASAAVDVMQVLAEKKSINLILQIDGEVPRVVADPKHVNQILINIVSNAIKYSRANGRVEVSVLSPNEGQVSIVVSDHGVGIAEKDIVRVFDKFERGSASTITSEGGTGLGLPLSKRLLEMNGGTIDLESKRGVGTKVTITLPVSHVVQDKGA